MKRFTATEKWGKGWFRQLTPRLKCLWSYLCENADCAGVWEPDFELASFQIGERVTESDLAAFGERISKLSSGKFHLTSFIEFQYGQLSESCKAHIPVFRSIQKHRLSIGYPKAMHSLQDTEKDKEEEKDKGSGEGKTPTLEQVRGAAVIAGVPPKVAEIFFHECEKRPLSVTGLWTDRGGDAIRNWRSAMKSYAMKWEANNHAKAPPSAAPQKKKPEGVEVK